MITNEKMQEMVTQTADIVNAAFGMGHVRFRPTEMLGSPIAAVVLQRLIDDEQDWRVEAIQTQRDEGTFGTVPGSTSSLTRSE